MILRSIGGFFNRLGALIAAVTRAVWNAGMTAAGKSFYALIATIAGAGVLCGFLAWALDWLMGNKQYDPVAYIAYGLLFGVLMSVFSLGKLLAGKQAIEAELWKFKFKASQDGDDDEEPPVVTPPST